MQRVGELMVKIGGTCWGIGGTTWIIGGTVEYWWNIGGILVEFALCTYLNS